MTTSYDTDTRPLPDPEAQIVDLVRQIRELQDAAEMTARQIHILEADKIRVTRDIGIIADALREEAISRDWCSDYGVFVDGLNSQTSAAWLQHCMEDRVATFVISFRYSARHGRNDTVVEAFRESLRDGQGYEMPGDADLTDIDVTLSGDVRE